MSEDGQVCDEINNVFLLGWNRSGWVASKSFHSPLSEHYLSTGRKTATSIWRNW